MRESVGGGGEEEEEEDVDVENSGTLYLSGFPSRWYACNHWKQVQVISYGSYWCGSWRLLYKIANLDPRP